MSATKKQPLKFTDAKEFSTAAKPVKQFYNSYTSGAPTLPPNPQYSDEVAQTATKLKELLESITSDIKALEGSLTQKRTTKTKPRLCDARVTDFISAEFNYPLPRLGEHGICDPNKIIPRAFSEYYKRTKKDGINSQFVNLDDKVARIFRSPTVRDKNVTYLEFVQDRIRELTGKRNDETKNAPKTDETKKKRKTTGQVAFVSVAIDGTISINQSALKIVYAAFALDYELENADLYVNTLDTFADQLKKLADDTKKQSKTKQ